MEATPVLIFQLENLFENLIRFHIHSNSNYGIQGSS